MTADNDALTQAVRDELVQLWGDLTSAVRDAIEGGWSIQCDNLADRISTLSALVGATPWDEVDVGLLLGGQYERVHRVAGITHPAVDWVRVREVQRRIEEQRSSIRREASR
jgi:hypothetical protein